MSNHALTGLIHQMDSRLLLGLVRANMPTADLHREIRHEFARYASTGRAQYDSWQAAWNAMTGATKNRPGHLRVTPSRCADCHGRRFRLDRRLGQFTGCMTCNVTGRGQPVRLVALYAPEPETTPTPQQED